MGEDGAGVRTGLGHVGSTCVLQTQFSSFQLGFLVKKITYSGPPPPQKKKNFFFSIWMLGKKNHLL